MHKTIFDHSYIWATQVQSFITYMYLVISSPLASTTVPPIVRQIIMHKWISTNEPILCITYMYMHIFIVDMCLTEFTFQARTCTCTCALRAMHIHVHVTLIPLKYRDFKQHPGSAVTSMNMHIHMVEKSVWWTFLCGGIQLQVEVVFTAHLSCFSVLFWLS